jgi:O-antigen/teichoic acid export membrane protein
MMIVSRVAVLGCGLVLMGYLTRKLGLDEYGLYALAVLLVNWIGVSIGLATGGALVRLVAGRADGHRFAVSMLQLVALVSGGCCSLILLGAGTIAAALKSPGLADLLRILAIDLPLGGLAGLHLGILTARGEFLKNALGNLAGWVFQLATAVVFLEGGWAAQGAAWAVVGGSAGQFVLARAMSGVSIFSRERVGFSELWAETRLLASAQVALRVSQSMDLLAVKFFLVSPTSVGLYAGVQNIGFAALMLFQPTNPIVQQSMSKSRREENHAEAAQVAQTFLRVALIYGGILISLGVFSEEISVFLLGEKFKESGPVLAVLLVAAAFRIQALAGRTLIATAGEKVSILLPLLVLIAIGLVGFAIVTPGAGLLGAAVVAALMALGTAYLSLRDGVRLLNLRYPWATFARVVVAGAATAGLGCGLRGFGLHVLVDLTLATLCYGALLLLLREWRPTRQRLRDLAKRIANLPKWA